MVRMHVVLLVASQYFYKAPSWSLYTSLRTILTYKSTSSGLCAKTSDGKGICVDGTSGSCNKPCATGVDCISGICLIDTCCGGVCYDGDFRFCPNPGVAKMLFVKSLGDGFAEWARPRG